jgi:hypothetical protein
MRYVEALNYYDLYGTDTKLFLAGGITGCPDWQQEMVSLLKETSLTILNPRRANFPIHDPSAAQEQIEWEHHAFRAADVILFWFPKETLCPIVLYELGAWSMTSKRVFIGVHPEYSRLQDVKIQTALARPEIEIVHSFDELVGQIKDYDPSYRRGLRPGEAS